MQFSFAVLQHCSYTFTPDKHLANIEILSYYQVSLARQSVPGQEYSLMWPDS
jgi:hypothetical protein